MLMLADYLIKGILIIGVPVLLRMTFRRLTVFEYEKGLKYAKGRFKGILDPGQYWYVSFLSDIRKLDMRPTFVSIKGQEILTSDGISLKISLAAKYRIEAPDQAINDVWDYKEAIWLELQLALRELIGGLDVETLLEKRGDLSGRLMELTEEKIGAFGIKLLSVNIKDIMFPGRLKEVFAQGVKARKEGLAALEKARGETAALRKLANAAKMIESNPHLMQLRLIQSLGDSSGNTLFLGMPPGAEVVPVKTPAKTKDSESPGS